MSDRPGKYTDTVSVACTPAQGAFIRAAADASKMSVSRWSRAVLLELARRTLVRSRDEENAASATSERHEVPAP